jgi:heme exporter protein C
VSAVSIAAGLYLALFVAPADYQQSESVRIMYVHVPSAWMALFIYTNIAVASAVALIWRHPLADLAAKASSPVGAGFTFLALVTGSLWGKPMWGTWWVWDARLTSVLILFFLYLGHMAQGGGCAGAGRLRQRADHQVLGRLVEHPAPAVEHAARGRPEHPP